MIHKLNAMMAIAQIHADKMALAHERLADFFPLTPKTLETLTNDDQAYVEVLVNRFSKLQDYIGTKIFPALLKSLHEQPSGPTFIDTINHLEKIEMIPSADFWIDLRDLGNEIAHEYPNDAAMVVKHLNQIWMASAQLSTFWKGLKKRVEGI